MLDFSTSDCSEAPCLLLWCTEFSLTISVHYHTEHTNYRTSYVNWKMKNARLMKTWHKLVTTYSKMQLECWATHRICITVWCGDHCMHRVLDLFYRPFHINKLGGIGNVSIQICEVASVTRFPLLCVRFCALLSQNTSFPEAGSYQNILRKNGVHLIFHLRLGLFNSVLSAFALMPNKIRFVNTVC